MAKAALSYACTECGDRFDAVQAFTDDTLTTCTKCSGRLRKLFNSVGVVFKGSGFYRTDSRESGKKTSESTESSNSEPAKSDSASSSSSTESKTSSSTEKSSSSSTPATAGASK